MHNDGGSLDGHFTGMLLPGLPAGAEIQFYLEATDLTGQTLVLPDEPVFSPRGQPVTIYSATIGIPAPAIEISELVADNLTGLRDETNGAPDWVEIRNLSTSTIPLRGVTLARSFLGNGSRHAFSDTDQLLPGEHRVVLCDNPTAASAAHAPFTLDRNGDQLFLTGLGQNGGRLWIDSVQFGKQTTDVAWARMGSGGPWISSIPTPRSQNIPGEWLTRVATNGTDVIVGFATTTNGTYTLQYKDSLDATSLWNALPSVAGDGIEKIVVQPMASRRFYRFRRDD